MKIEIGESLLYSWLRHINKCQIVQTNWKASKKWQLKNIRELEKLLEEFSSSFKQEFKTPLFSNDQSLQQLIFQTECDLIGISMQSEKNFFATEIAFHSDGLHYNRNGKRVNCKPIEKAFRIALCLYGYFNTKSAKIIFSSPKIGKKDLEIINKHFDFANSFFSEKSYSFQFEVIANENFSTKIVTPILDISDKISDSNELFVRAHQLIK